MYVCMYELFIILHVLSACISVHHLQVILEEAIRRYEIFWTSSSRQLRAVLYVVEIKPRPLEKKAVLVTAKPSPAFKTLYS